MKKARKGIAIGALACGLAISWLLAGGAFAKPQEIGRAEYNKMANDAHDKFELLDRSVKSVPSEATECNQFRMAGKNASRAFAEAMELQAKTFAKNMKAWKPLEAWGKELYERAEAYGSLDDQETVRGASRKIHTGAAEAQDSWEFLGHATKGFGSLQCKQAADLRNAADFYSEGRADIRKGFSALQHLLERTTQ